MNFEFKPATRENLKARIALVGPSGSGKTFTALVLAQALAQGGTVGVLDTERRSASKYAGRFAFHALDLPEHSPANYVKAIQAAERAGISVLVIDSLSHAWMGKGGALEQVDQAARRSKGNSFAAWRDVTPQHNALVEAILGADCHVIATMRAKTDYAMEQDGKGRTQVRKVGLAPIQRDGVEYEFDIVADIDPDHNFMVTKSRCEDLDGAVINRPGPEVGARILSWLTEGTPAAPRTEASTPPTAAPSTRRERPDPMPGSFSPPTQDTPQGFSQDETWKAANRRLRAILSNSGLTKDEASRFIEATKKAVKVASLSHVSPDTLQKIASRLDALTSEGVDAVRAKLVEMEGAP